MLKIKNIHKIIGEAYDYRLDIVAVKEHKLCYEFTLGLKDLSSRQSHTILIHRKPTESGHYIMEYQSKTLWLKKDEFDTIDKMIICMNTI